jgi:uncharacterized membrane protein YbhN (UPF0104 family)
MPGEVFEETGQKEVYTVSPSKVLRWIFQLGIGAVLLWWIVQRVNIDFVQLSTAVGEASLLDLGLALGFFAVSILLKTIQYKICSSLTVQNRYLFGLFLSQNALLTMLPLRVGEVGLPLLLRRTQGIPVIKTVSNLVIVRLVDLILIGVIVALSGARFGIVVSWTTIIVIAALLCSIFYFAKVATGWSSAPKFIKLISVAFEPAYRCPTLGFVAILSVGVFIATTLQSALALRAFGLPLPLLDVAILNATSLLVAVLPLHPPGGWGTMDLVQVVLLRQLGFRPEVTTPVILVTHGFYTLVVILGGLLGWWLCRNSSSR